MSEPLVSGLSDAVIASRATGATWVAGAGSSLAWIANLDWLSIIGLVVAIGTFLTNWYYRKRADRREAAESSLRLERYRIDIKRMTGE